MKIYIQEPIRAFLEEALPKLQDFETIENRCPVCGRTMGYPVVARSEDIEAFEKLLEIAKKYLNESGVTEAMLSNLLKRINERLNLQ